MISDPVGSSLKVIGQEQRHGQRRPDAGEHADRRAERHADQREEEVVPLERDEQTRRRGREANPSLSRLQKSGGRRRPDAAPPSRDASRLERPGGQHQLQAHGEEQPDRQREDHADRIGEPELGPRPRALAVAAKTGPVASEKPAKLSRRSGTISPPAIQATGASATAPAVRPVATRTPRTRCRGRAPNRHRRDGDRERHCGPIRE